jgi:two-component system, OmpR family, sensor kinase
VTLRIRLLSGFAFVLAIIVAGAIVLIRAQDAYLTELVDRQLLSAMTPITRVPGPLFGTDATAPPRPRGPSSPDAPISDLFLGIVIDGELVPLLRGQLLADVPAVALDDASLARAAGAGPSSVAGVAGSSRFRILVVRPLGAIQTAVVALPLASVDAAVDRLTLTLLLGILVIAGVLALVVWWVERLGLRPIERLTATADAIARGERGQRAGGADTRTEAGKLATAFNVMLDEHDAGEERLRRFVADASHELRTPLTSIRGYLDLAQDGGFRDEQEQSDMLRRMSREASRMSDLVEDLLLLARLDEHRPLRSEPVDIGALLDDAALDARVLQPQRTIAVDVAGDGPLSITGDPFRLEQVVGALVHNALAYTEPTARLDLGARLEGDRALVTVGDTGPGLAPEAAERVFDRFVRGEESRSRRSGGSGLGLSIAKAIVEAHGGSITLETAPGAGCRFTISLPR